MLAQLVPKAPPEPKALPARKASLAPLARRASLAPVAPPAQLGSRATLAQPARRELLAQAGLPARLARRALLAQLARRALPVLAAPLAPLGLPGRGALFLTMIHRRIPMLFGWTPTQKVRPAFWASAQLVRPAPLAPPGRPAQLGRLD